MFLKKFAHSKAKGRIRADADGDTFTVKCLGIFDTVGALGIPGEFKRHKKIRSVLGFSDTHLGEHIQYVFHAMALDETRVDFVSNSTSYFASHLTIFTFDRMFMQTVTKFKQTEAGQTKGQVLEQLWFSGEF
jgi:hypothetical protein